MLAELQHTSWGAIALIIVIAHAAGGLLGFVMILATERDSSSIKDAAFMGAISGAAAPVLVTIGWIVDWREERARRARAS